MFMKNSLPQHTVILVTHFAIEVWLQVLFKYFFRTANVK